MARRRATRGRAVVQVGGRRGQVAAVELALEAQAGLLHFDGDAVEQLPVDRHGVFPDAAVGLVEVIEQLLREVAADHAAAVTEMAVATDGSTTMRSPRPGW